MEEKRKKIKSLMLSMERSLINLMKAEKELEVMSETLTSEEEAMLEGDAELTAIADRINNKDY